VGVSDIDLSRAITVVGTTVPGLTSRETSTKVEVRDGETVVISGIKQSKRTKVIRRVPILGYIPLLGFFFRNKTEEVSQSSVVVFVTFRLIK
jgi:pilus assembly protein CpaC